MLPAPANGQPRPARTRLLRAAALLMTAAGLTTLVLALRAWPLDPIATARRGCLALAGLAAGTGIWLLPRHGPTLARRLFRRPRLLRLAIAGAAAGIALLGSEVALRLGGAFAHATDVEVRAAHFVEPDARLGYRLVADRQIDVDLVRVRDEAFLGHVRYTIDGDGHRRTVLPQADGHDRAVVFFGCSQTFGHGLDDYDTLPSRYAAAMPRDRVTNLAVPGYGPHQALVLARDTGTLACALPPLPRPPIGVFVWIDHHLLRLCGSLRVRNTYGLDAPSFAVGQGGHAELRGPFRTAEPVRSMWFWALDKSKLLRLCGYDWPGDYRSEDLDLAAAVFRDLAAALAERGGHLLLAQYPLEHTGALLHARLADADIAYCDLTGLFDPYANGMSIDRDGHPTPAATALLGARLADEVRRAFP